MIDIKTSEQLDIMTEGGKKLGQILKYLLSMAQTGANLLDIEKKAMELIRKSGGSPSFLTVEDYRWATCLCINDEVVHGIPRNRILSDGDLLTIDIGLLYKGFHTDTASTIMIAKSDSAGASYRQKLAFLTVGQNTLEAAIRQAMPGNRIGDISAVIENIIQSAGYSVIRTLVGHGIGKILHEEPQVPGIVRGDPKNTPLLKAGMTIAIEIIYAQKKPHVVYSNDDGWTIGTKDRSVSAVFEHTVAITEKGPIILTER